MKFKIVFEIENIGDVDYVDLVNKLKNNFKFEVENYHFIVVKGAKFIYVNRNKIKNARKIYYSNERI